MEVPAHISALCDELIAMPGATAVVVGGSRAAGAALATSDWDLGVYYRDAVDLPALAAQGRVPPPGAWGRIMNGGAWLQLHGTAVDVLLRDLTAVEQWAAAARQGRFDIDGLPGYVAGIPTYSLVAEASTALVVRGVLELDTAFPDALATAAPLRWRFNRDFSLHHASMHADRGNTAGVVGQSARAVFEEAHARHCERSRWALNEKRLVADAGMDHVQDLLAEPGRTPAGLHAVVDAIADALAEA
jgi:hypothetical protein